MSLERLRITPSRLASRSLRSAMARSGSNGRSTGGSVRVCRLFASCGGGGGGVGGGGVGVVIATVEGGAGVAGATSEGGAKGGGDNNAEEGEAVSTSTGAGRWSRTAGAVHCSSVESQVSDVVMPLLRCSYGRSDSMPNVRLPCCVNGLLVCCSTSKSTGSRGHMALTRWSPGVLPPLPRALPTVPRVLAGDRGRMPYPQSGDDGIGENANDASSVTDFVGVGGIAATGVEVLKLPSESTRSSAKGRGLRRGLPDSPPVLILFARLILESGVVAVCAGGRRSTDP